MILLVKNYIDSYFIENIAPNWQIKIIIYQRSGNKKYKRYYERMLYYLAKKAKSLNVAFAADGEDYLVKVIDELQFVESRNKKNPFL